MLWWLEPQPLPRMQSVKLSRWNLSRHGVSEPSPCRPCAYGRARRVRGPESARVEVTKVPMVGTKARAALGRLRTWT